MARNPLLPLPVNGYGVHVDDLQPMLNVVQRHDLAQVLELTVAARRVAVAMAWIGLEYDRWSIESGLEPMSVGRWLRGHHRMPLGAAVRLARVVGVDPILLFAALL